MSDLAVVGITLGVLAAAVAGFLLGVSQCNKGVSTAAVTRYWNLWHYSRELLLGIEYGPMEDPALEELRQVMLKERTHRLLTGLDRLP